MASEKPATTPAPPPRITPYLDRSKLRPLAANEFDAGQAYHDEQARAMRAARERIEQAREAEMSRGADHRQRQAERTGREVPRG